MSSDIGIYYELWVVVLCRESLSQVIITDLGNYRHKRVLGLAAMFGDQLVTSEFVVA